jgi:ribosomal protein RSM22 (predicted rRNA methylase)
MSQRPARTTANVRSTPPTGVISRSGCRARAPTNRSRKSSFRFEDEKFSYLALTRAAVSLHPARVLAQPVVTKIEVTAKLCTAEGLAIAKMPHRAKAGYARARRWRWGDAVMEQD